MRHVASVCLGVLFFVTASAAVGAALEQTSTTEAVEAGKSDTRVEVDNSAGIVRVFVEGKEIVRIDSQGLHVEGEVSYSGKMTDIGEKAGQ